ncbi:50S ribosomal protein L32 [Nocardia sp. N13]
MGAHRGDLVGLLAARAGWRRRGLARRARAGVALATCANPACGAKHLPHRACGPCGQYGTKADRRQGL